MAKQTGDEMNAESSGEQREIAIETSFYQPPIQHAR